MTNAHTSNPRPRTWVHLTLLTLLCLLTYFPGLDTHGVTNWQEGQRLIVARDMQARADWLVPTVNARPYLAKPPMIYWAQLAVASALGQTVELWHLRFVVALAGLCGVLATYGAARELLAPDRPSEEERSFAERAALWSGVLLATGILYVRAARIGELDVLLVPFITVAVWAVARAFRAHRVHGRTNWPALGVATIAASCAVLTKDTGLLYVALAAYGGIVLWCASLRSARLRSLAAALSRTHPLLVLGVPAAARYGWTWLVGQRVGADKAALLARAELDDNVRFFVAEAPINNLETLLFGLGLGSALALAALVVLIRFRPRLTPGGAIVAAWIVLSLIAFSIFGKGVQRYLTPLWPAWAMLAGWLAAIWCRPRPLRSSPALWLGATILVLAIAQSFQYGFLRDRVNAHRSPRDLLAALRARYDWRGPDRLFSFEYTSPALDYYAGGFVQVVGDPRAGATMLAGEAWTLDQFRTHIVQNPGPTFMIVRDGRIPGIELAPVSQRLWPARLDAEELVGLPDFRIDNGRTAMRVLRVTPSDRAPTIE